MNTPLVTVICLCYNHSRFVQEAIESVLKQSYPNIQLIVVDDASTDNSVEVINGLVSTNRSIEFLSLKTNVGNCKSFNRGLALAKGDFIIDLAADDVLLMDRVDVGVKALQNAGEGYGVHFSDAELIAETGEHVGLHSEKYPHATIPQGDVYKDIISRYFVCPPTVMFTRKVIKDLGGYDESLAYEDFDLWIRSSRTFKYVYSPSALVKRRISKNALARKQFRVFSNHSNTTYKVCEKILKLNTSRSEQKALSKRIHYEIKLNVRLLNFDVVLKFIRLLVRNWKMNYSS